MIFKPLGTVAQIIAGQSPASSTYNSTGAGLPFFQGKADFQEMYPTVRIWCTSPKRKEAEPDDILISVRAPVGAVNICNQKSIIGRGLSAIRPSSSLNVMFLYYYLKANEKQIEDLGTGSTFKAITQETLKKIKIPILPLAEQKRIAHLLGKVARLIARRKQHLQQLDNLLKSVFLEMFGEPRQWALVPLESIALKGRGTFTNGPFGSNLLTSELTDTGVPVIYIRDIRDAEYRRVSTVCVTQEKSEELETCQVCPGDILIAKVGDPPGTSAIYPTDEPSGIITQDVIRIRPNLRKINPSYVSGYLNSIYGIRMIREITVEATRARFGLRDFKAQDIPLPPVELQNQFAAIVKKGEDLKSRYRQNLADLETLYSALSQKAFKDELDLSQVPLPKDQTHPADDEQENESSEPPQPKEDFDSGQKTDTDQTEHFNTWTFHEFLRARKDEVWTATNLWEELQKMNFENPPPSFESFKTWILTCLEQEEWLEQVYGEITADKHSNVKEKKIALRIRDDS